MADSTACCSHLHQQVSLMFLFAVFSSLKMFEFGVKDHVI